MHWLGELLIGVIVGFFWWFVLFPVVWLLTLPFILVIALFSRQPYAEAVRDMFSSVNNFWTDWGIILIP